MFRKFSLQSPAKINLVLKITGVRKNGYHTLATLFQMVELADTVTFAPAPSDRVRVECPGLRVPERENLVYRAARLLWKPGCAGVRITIKKNIPSGAGLGGGSSNAATALMALNHIWGLGHDNVRLRKLAVTLGADVPFFLFAPRAWATGIGEKLAALPPADDFHILLVKPRVNIATAGVYRAFDAQLTTRLNSIKIPVELSKEGVLLEDTVEFIENDLEKPVLANYPVIKKIEGHLRRSGGKGVCLTGSGSAVFALFNDLPCAKRALRTMDVRPWWRCLTRPRKDMQHVAGLLGG